MKGYEKYVEVESRWAKYIPESWTFSNIAEVFIERKENNNPIKTMDILSLTNTRGVIPYKEKGNIGNKAKEDLTGYRLAYPGDIVFNSMNAVIGSVGLSKYFGAVSPVYYMLYLRDTVKNSVRYFDYVFQDKVFQNGLNGLGNGILEIRMRIPMSKLKYVGVPVPPRAEQDQIVRYLDWQVSKINRLIAAKKRQLSILAEYRKAKIDEIILHGDKQAPQKDSGIWWLRDIPQSWQVIPLKRICQVNASISNTAKQLSDEELVTFLPMESVSTTGAVDYSEKRRLADVRSGYSSFAKYDVVIAKITPCFENGKGACLDLMDTDIGYGTTEFINLRASNRILPRYLYMITVTQPFRKLGEEIMTGSAGQKRIPLEFVKGFAVGIPPIEEQARLLSLLNDVTMRIDSQTISCHEAIISLQELRTRLISDAVTGQIDVRNIEVPDYVVPETDTTLDNAEEDESNEE